MKKIICMLLALCCILCACENVKRVTLTDGGFLDSETGIKYVMCSATMSLRPLKAENVFATDGKKTYYTIQWEDTGKYLCDYDNEAAAFVYRAEDAEDITLSSFQPISALVYVEGKASVYVDTFYCAPEFLPPEDRELAGRDDSELVYSIRDALVGGENVNVPTSDITTEDTYYIRLLSQKYPGMYYIAIFFGDVNGNYYLTDRSTGRTVIAPSNVKQRMVG